MEFKQSFLGFVLITYSFKLMGMFVDPCEPMHNTKWKKGKGDRLALYSLLNNPDSSAETKQGCIGALSDQLFAADPFCLPGNIQELLCNQFPQKALLQATTFATNVIDSHHIKQVHPLERWTLMHYAAYAVAQRYQLDKDLRKDGPLPVGKYVPDDSWQPIIYLIRLGMPFRIKTSYENWCPPNYKADSVSTITVTPENVVRRFSQEVDLVRKIFDPNIMK